jgi:putative PIG3 family NAD(P)H quinone oxidoreductase
MIEATAVRIVGKGDVDVLEMATVPVPAPGPHEVLVRVAAVGLNRADVLQRRGYYAAPPGVPADVPGLEYAGYVEQLGEGVLDLTAGEAVMGIVAGGAMCTHVVVHERECIRVPTGMPVEEAAAVPEVFFTAYDALFDQARLGVGELLLVHAVGSGVGTAALQFGLVCGAEVAGTSRTQNKLARCRALGLAEGFLVQENSFAAAFATRMGGRGADVVLDLVGAAYLADNVAALALRGRIVVLGLVGGAKAELSLGALLAKRAQLVGSVLRSRPLEEKAALAQSFAKNALPLFARGKLKPIMDCVLPMSEVRLAHKRMEQNETFGKIVLRW